MRRILLIFRFCDIQRAKKMQSAVQILHIESQTLKEF